MRLTRAMIATLCLAGPAAAQTLDFSDRGFTEAALSQMLIDELKGQCPAAAQAPLDARVRVWETANRSAQMRRAISTARADAQGARRYEVLRKGMTERLTQRPGQACLLLEAWLTAPGSRLADNQPAVFAALGGGAAPAAAASAAPSARAAASPSGLEGLGPDVQGYGLIQTYGFGYGGMMVMNLEPAILFKSGEILTRVNAITAPGGLAADRRANPRHWSRWRRTGAVYEYATQGGKWNKFFGDKVWSSPPSAGGLSGTFVHVGGAGNTALGGTDAVFTQTSYQFLPGGRLVRQGMASGSSEFEGGGSTTRTVANTRSGARPGRYVVEGLLMKVTYDGGGQDVMTLMTHPSDRDIIWLNGASYTRKK